MPSDSSARDDSRSSAVHPPIATLAGVTAAATLYIEELKATMRGRFAWLGAGVVLLAVGALATVGTQDTWLDGYGIIAYGLVPLAFVPVTAGAIASPRANRFVESLFTAPVRRGEWLAAKLLVVLTFAGVYYLALAPMMFVYASHVGFPLLLRRFLLWTPGLLVVSVAVGALIGVLFIGRSIAAPLATGMGVLVVYAGLMPLQELMVAQGNGASRTGHLALLSPAVLLKNALGFTLVASSVPSSTARTWIVLLTTVVGACALAVWVFLRAQGVETWEASRRQRWIITGVIVAMVLAPVVLADTDYDRAAPAPTAAPAIRGLFARAGASLALVAPGGQPPARCCSTILNRDVWPFGTDTATRQDLLLLLPVESSQPIARLHVQLSGEDGLQAVADPGALERAADHLETRSYRGDLGPAAADGHHVARGWVVRIPLTLTPTRPWDIGGDRYPLRVDATYTVAGETHERTFSARGAVNAEVASAIYEMGIVSVFLPLVCFGAAVIRWQRTR
jgi:ABC-type transport system involved in multi-copper enzyme maturation permease subunit